MMTRTPSQARAAAGRNSAAASRPAAKTAATTRGKAGAKSARVSSSLLGPINAAGECRLALKGGSYLLRLEVGSLLALETDGGGIFQLVQELEALKIGAAATLILLASGGDHRDASAIEAVAQQIIDTGVIPVMTALGEFLRANLGQQ